MRSHCLKKKKKRTGCCKKKHSGKNVKFLEIKTMMDKIKNSIDDLEIKKRKPSRK